MAMAAILAQQRQQQEKQALLEFHRRQNHDAGPVGRPRQSMFLRALSLEYAYEELAAATLDWDVSRRLGNGAFGAVYKGELEDGTAAAIKVIDLAALSRAGQDPNSSGFDEEVQVLSKFRHPNLVTLMGWGKHEPYRYLIYELMPGGDVAARLAKCKKPVGGKPFTWHERLNVLLDAVTGLSHMHNAKPKAFHRDIKSANILLDKNGTAKMADFGLSFTAVCSDDQMKGVSGTPGYLCPVYARTSMVTIGAESYSFGMVILEVLTGVPPAVADRRQPGGIGYPIGCIISPSNPRAGGFERGAMQRLQANLDLAAAWPAAVVGELATVGLRSVNAVDESARPPSVEVVKGLRSMLARYPEDTVDQNPPARKDARARTASPRIVAAAAAAAASAGAEAARSPRHHTVHAAGAPQPVARPLSSPPNRQASNASMNGVAVTNGNHLNGSMTPANALNKSTSFGNYGSAGGLLTMCPLRLQLILASGVDVQMLPLERRVIPLQQSPTNVGRVHQTSLLEVWLPDKALRESISRTSFAVSWEGAGNKLSLSVLGNNPLAVDGHSVPKGSVIGLSPGSEIGFPYSASNLDVFLLLRLESLQPRFKLSMCFVKDPASDALCRIPPHLKQIALSEGNTLVGRQHQAEAFLQLQQFLSGDDVTKISRTHIDIRVEGDGVPLLTNVSSWPVVVCDRILNQREASPLPIGAVISFCKSHDGLMSPFLSLRLDPF
eukprot:TRINITY_DN20887_c0_g4_i1.p1 TRINITY_DN20887_c0_g4~~TRINITY_DN20887_c0_g4_i1.p1  ORF type:complete len:722 (+),score=115.23 TRINITY_DN20887_c0_g4_i1:60-2225(+)